jgi:hypothetical protein
MAELPIDKRRFTDREVREIMEKAVEEASRHAPSSGEGLSLKELKSIGAEAGIDPERLEQAAREVALQKSSGPELGGGGTILLRQRRFEGEIGASWKTEALSLVRQTFGVAGEVSELGDSVEWRATEGGRERLVTISSRGGSTTIEAMSNLRQSAVGAYTSGGLIAIVSSVIGIILSVDQPDLSIDSLVVSLGLLPAAYLLLRIYVQRLAASEAAKLERTIEQVGALTVVVEEENESERGG